MKEPEKLYKVFIVKDQFCAIIMQKVDTFSSLYQEWRIEDGVQVLKYYVSGTDNIQILFIFNRNLNLDRSSETTYILIEILTNEFTNMLFNTCHQIMTNLVGRGLNKDDIIRECHNNINSRKVVMGLSSNPFPEFHYIFKSPDID